VNGTSTAISGVLFSSPVTASRASSSTAVDPAIAALAAKGAYPPASHEHSVTQAMGTARSQTARSTVAMASTAIPSPRPTKPIPSPRVALTLTAEDSDAQRPGKPIAHGRRCGAMRGALGDDRGVDVHDGEPGIVEHRRDAPDEVERVGVPPRLLGVGKVLADVAQAGRPQQRVDDGVGEDVGVRMAVEPEVVVDLDAAEHQPPVRYEPVERRSRCRGLRSSHRSRRR